MSLGIVLAIFAIGLVAGLIGALFGLGGGILVVPALAIGFDVPMHTAIATSLLCGIATSSAAASRNMRLGIANVKLGLLLEPWTVSGAIIGGLIAGMLPGSTLMKIFGVTIILMAIPMGTRLIPGDTPAGEGGAAVETSGAYYDTAIQQDVSYDVERLSFARGTSSLAGVLSGLLGVGGGIIQVPVLTLACKMPMKAAAATSNFMIGVTAVASALIYYGRGHVVPTLAAACVVGVFAGSRLGVIVSGKVHGEALRKGFAVVMVLIGIRLVLKGQGVAN